MVFNWFSPWHFTCAQTHFNLRPLSSINKFPLQITQQINHHGYSNVIIAVHERGSDRWCSQGHLEIDNYRENKTCTIHFCSRMNVEMHVWSTELARVQKTEGEDLNVIKLERSLSVFLARFIYFTAFRVNLVHAGVSRSCIVSEHDNSSTCQ